MENVFKGFANKGGVYRILNKKNGREYYGSTARFKQRSREHFVALRKGTHYNLFLQRDFNKCGEEVFQFEVIEVVPRLDDKNAWSTARVTAEQKYLDEVYDNRQQCYNGTPYAIDLGHRPWEEDRKKKMSVTMSKLYSNPKRKQEAKQHAQKRWDRHTADIVVTHKKTHETVIINGSVRSFCEARGLSYKAFHLMVQGKTKSSGGWFLGTQEPEYVERKGEKRKPLGDEHRAKIAGGKYAGVVLKHKVTGEQFVVGENAKEDCRQRGISYSSFQKMMKGKCKSASKWLSI